MLPPKSRKQVGWREEWDVGGLQSYRAPQQFLWAFLKGEARGGDVVAAAKDLAEAYPFLKLSPKAIAAGLANPHQADDETGRYFGIKTEAYPAAHDGSARQTIGGPAPGGAMGSRGGRIAWARVP